MEGVVVCASERERGSDIQKDSKRRHQVIDSVTRFGKILKILATF